MIIQLFFNGFRSYLMVFRNNSEIIGCVPSLPLLICPIASPVQLSFSCLYICFMDIWMDQYVPSERPPANNTYWSADHQTHIGTGEPFEKQTFILTEEFSSTGLCARPYRNRNATDQIRQITDLLCNLLNPDHKSGYINSQETKDMYVQTKLKSISRIY